MGRFGGPETDTDDESGWTFFDCFESPETDTSDEQLGPLKCVRKKKQKGSMKSERENEQNRSAESKRENEQKGSAKSELTKEQNKGAESDTGDCGEWHSVAKVRRCEVRRELTENEN